MKITFETEEELIGFCKTAALPWGERLSPLVAIDFAISEMEEFAFMRNDLMIRLDSQISQLDTLKERMTRSLRAYEQAETERAMQAKPTATLGEGPGKLNEQVVPEI